MERGKLRRVLLRRRGLSRDPVQKRDDALLDGGLLGNVGNDFVESIGHGNFLSEDEVEQPLVMRLIGEHLIELPIEAFEHEAAIAPCA